VVSADWHPHGGARRAAGLGSDGGLPPLPQRPEGPGLGPDEAHLAWELARAVPELDGPARRALRDLAALVLEALSRGSTWVRMPAPTEAWAALGLDAAKAGPRLAAWLTEAPSTVVGPPAGTAPLVRVDDRVASRRAFEAEERLRSRLTALDGPAPLATPTVPATLNEAQRQAVERVLERRVTVVSGGPGTGKTSIVRAVLAALTEAGVDAASIALAAPTGKAADRMRESLGDGAASFDPPRTLHRLLGQGRHGFRHGPDRPLPHEVVIVDEGSMVDLFLMERLVASLRPEARLLILGDPEQLPSVAAGAVFRDLGRLLPQAGVRLRTSYRMDPTRPDGRHILAVAEAIRGGRVPPTRAAAGPGPVEEGLPTWTTVPPLEALGGVHLSTAALDAFLDRWAATHHDPADAVLGRAEWPVLDGRVAEGAVDRLAPLFLRMRRARLLAVTRGQRTGVRALNRALARRAGVLGEALEAGEPALVRRNDHERGLFNGDQGIVLRVARVGLALVVRRRADRFDVHPLAAVAPILDRGYATTVHQAQGSEHDQVGLVLPAQDRPRLFTRELLYTGLTRARRSVVVVGAPEALLRGATRRIERVTGLVPSDA
jgi:exodeoxyribonuclease V alpha subunit